MSEIFKGFEQLLELARLIEEKAEKGEFKADVHINARPLSSIPRSSMPRPSPIPRDGGVSSRQPPSPATEVIVTPPTAQPVPLLRDVGGMATVLQTMRELVELPLKRPDVLQKLGLEPPRGVLLVGPPETGKTLTARGIAQELGVNYVWIP